jgi:beta-alanine--pyruvate transaminase
MPHGYTYSAHPVACAAGLGTMQVYEEEGLLTRVGEIAKYWEDAAHSMRDCPNVIDIRNIGLIAAIELAPRPARRARGHGNAHQGVRKRLRISGARGMCWRLLRR